MKRIRYLTVLVLFLMAVLPAAAQDGFNPANPAEPGVPPVALTLAAEPANGGRVSGGGKYAPGTTVSVRATSNTGFTFSHWTDAEGNTVSETAAFSHIKGSAAEAFTAHFVYTPSDPSEPQPGTSLVYYRLTVNSDVGGTASGGGRYRSGTRVRLSASTATNFEFAGWVNEAGDTVSAEMSFYYTTQERAETLTATFRYNPASPSEPSDPVLRHRITLSSTEGGTASAGSLSVLSGSATTLTARANPGYVFTGWYLDGELYTTLESFSYTMGDKNVAFEARFEFNPTNPDEPAKPTDKQYALYLMSEVTFPGGRIDCPLWLTILDPLGDMTFQLTFPAEAVPDWSTLRLGDRAAGYTVSVAETAEEGVWQLTLTGSTMPAGNAMLLTVQADVPETVEPSTSYQVKINQVSVAEESGQTVTASTRNGRVYVYKLGDTNGDGEVDVLDCLNMVGYLLNGAPDDDSFIEEVSDVNADGEYDVMDSVGIQEIILSDN